MSSARDAAAIDAILNPMRTWSRTELTSDATVIPASPGIYAWYFTKAPPRAPTDGCLIRHGRLLLYIGIADNLRLRIIGQHFRARGRSTLRRTLGVLLEDELSLAIRPRGNSFDYGHTEERITEWMSPHAFVTWAEHPAPHQIERDAIQKARPPLNLNHNTHHPFHPHLTALRKSARERAHGSAAPP